MARDENMIAALKRERAAYAAAGDADRVSQVDEQLKNFGYEGEQDAVVDPTGLPKDRTGRAGRQRTADGAQQPTGKSPESGSKTEAGKAKS